MSMCRRATVSFSSASMHFLNPADHPSHYPKYNQNCCVYSVLNLSGNSVNILHSLKYSPTVLDSQSRRIHRLRLFAYFKRRLLSVSENSSQSSSDAYIMYPWRSLKQAERTRSPFVARRLDRLVGLKVVTRVWRCMPRQILVCCFVSIVASVAYSRGPRSRAWPLRAAPWVSESINTGWASR